MNIFVYYYAQLLEDRGVATETVTTKAATVLELFQELNDKYHLSVPRALLRVAVNDAFTDWDTPLKDGDRIVFVPPVAGG